MTISGDPIVKVEAAAINGVSDGSKKRPYLVFCSAPASGHSFPILQIAAEMIQRGFEATYIAGEEFQPQIKRMGAEFAPLPNILTPEMFEAREKVPSGNARLMWDLSNIFIRWVPIHFRVLMDTLAKIREKRPDQQVIIVHESFFMGLTPMMLGAPLPKGYPTRPPVVDVNVAPLVGTSIDTGPFGPALPPDSTESGRARNALLNSMFFGPNGPFAEPAKEYNAIAKSLGATKELSPDLFGAWQSSYDVTLQMCTPSLEYPRSDLPDVIKYAGCLPPKPIDPNYKYPDWWSDITAGNKKIVAVAQGTVVLDYTNLVIPTFQGLAHRDDIIVVAILGKKGATLPEEVTVPANTRVVDFISYDALLKYADVWVMNAGYGGFMHGVTNGVPMVLGGDSEDKPEVAMRGQWAGVAYNLKTGNPTSQQVADGVEEVLSNGEYKKRVMEIKKESEEFKALDVVEKHIWAYADSA
ncbi:UDP-N-acetyl-D-glucosamine 6-dehydrogenase [Colletotrichum spaethianum]|uniref:UDP-N-acetyl-D-glucosamine 6-dehydrogenase n=1 Tax=Colletotrichum spaethianum TaxID=700344 RepID=A0AA37UST5_9PEZI|nr:UDP-N-acetyl-D-glucosamine 6-dehydrogenase [Colletotrichum spaethianum]GKT50478.1 UDP-N-acetyl-D-glucosamine 6-dehydrogenase [Colletotrichum spaethianum]